MRQLNRMKNISLSVVVTGAVVLIVLTALGIALLFFSKVYEGAMAENAVTGTERAVVQVINTVKNYTDDIERSMEIISESVKNEDMKHGGFFQDFVRIRSDVVALSTYDQKGEMLNCWSNGLRMKADPLKNLSYDIVENDRDFVISRPHVSSLFEEYYPWVVTISKNMRDKDGDDIQIMMDIRFSNIANYVDGVGIGQHGYCFIMDHDGNIIYHPQQQLIYSGLKAEMVELKNSEDGTYMQSNVIYHVATMEHVNWRIVGVSYVDEMITNNVRGIVRVCLILLFLVLITAVMVGSVFSSMFSKPANRLAKAMRDFEKNAEKFEFAQIRGTSEIISLSRSFGHMVLRVQRLMEKVREEEISLRKTELKALQAQINPHFLYNTLDSIAWMCEESRTEEAIVMVNALARLFRISISKGNEMIPIEKELQHAESYLKIQNFRYKNKFTYYFDVDDTCLQYLCNKITLQPIIENAIYHGLNTMVDVGRIDIRVRQDNGNILLEVEDNGIGMSQEKCTEILHGEAGSRTGIGIKNVNHRIRIYFGEAYGISIFSEQDVGTRVEIRIPKVTEDTL